MTIERLEDDPTVPPDPKLRAQAVPHERSSTSLCSLRPLTSDDLVHHTVQAIHQLHFLEPFSSIPRRAITPASGTPDQSCLKACGKRTVVVPKPTSAVRSRSSPRWSGPMPKDSRLQLVPDHQDTVARLHPARVACRAKDCCGWLIMFDVP